MKNVAQLGLTCSENWFLPTCSLKMLCDFQEAFRVYLCMCAPFRSAHGKLLQLLQQIINTRVLSVPLIPGGDQIPTDFFCFPCWWSHRVLRP